MKLTKAVFRFRRTNLSTLLVITYLVITTLYVWDHFRYHFTLPSDYNYAQMLADAWLDLEIITQYPHPYASHANDKVHDYLLDRVKEITRDSMFAEISDDYGMGLRTLFRQEDAISGTKESTVVYYESSNVLARVQGRNSALDGLLLSAHYDSVPSGYGATDDGMGVVSMLAILTHYVKNQPERTLVFNFNNNQEFGLAGASAFFEHPWSKEISYVINLEGTGAGGKAVLFRTSDVSTAQVYAEAVRQQPFGNSMYQQGFYNGHIGTETDFQVYEDQGLRGWDIAFYRPRNLYHTAKDTVLYTSKQALWHMLHTALQLTDYMAINKPDMEDTSNAVYFDLFGKWFVVWSARSLFYWNCIILALFPSILAILFLVAYDMQLLKFNFWDAMLRLPVSVCLAYFCVKLFQVLVGQLNPYVFSRDYVSPILAEASMFIFMNYVILSSWERLRPLRDFKTVALVEVSMVLWIYLISVTRWLRDSDYTATGLYPFTIGYTFVSIGAIIGVFCATFKAKLNPEDDSYVGDSKVDIEQQQMLMQHQYQQHSQKHSNQHSPHHSTHHSAQHSVHHSPRQSIHQVPSSEQRQRDASETPHVIISVDHTAGHQEDSEVTPLLNTGTVAPFPKPVPERVSRKSFLRNVVTSILNYDWSIQFMVVTPWVTYFTWICLDLIMGAMNQTIQESAKGTTFVTHMALIGSLLLSLPMLPFTYKLHSFAGMLFLLLAVTTAVWTIVAPPFTESSPLKLRFLQTIDLDKNNSSSVYLYGRERTFMEPILDDIPSVTKYRCVEYAGDGVDICEYNGMPPRMFNNHHEAESDWTKIMTLEILKDDRNSTSRTPYQPITAELKINVEENRVCTLNFNSTAFKNWKQGVSPLREVVILHENPSSNVTPSFYNTAMKNGYYQDEFGNDHYRWNNGITELQLHKLDFKRGYYKIGLEWIPQLLYRGYDPATSSSEEDDALGVSVTCYWGEYDTDSITDGFATTNVPAYDELRKYSPKNIIYSSKEKGMVSVTKYVEL
ncbi:AGL209Wp [Eremothecium gossypii ATCC 10895]|uniref:Vacuolar membrane protease n=1 Tax=Eremothecium gossypii (strain ATCC 10895 / CBS 109.51 / FGSC 9923 / NRRL Y-1056) TaxID=284811 RepID=PFF1_EREGS|nr:AGL209Wp [Eremothecium gossypii ATCC 10895]Q750Z6.1 RecName: Full=Vacuolar membrane protease; AltName: Full=FXNA-related family protease 1 [Eremothecium gossypii ATCC 10895]AAS54282.1 AGL209Wp [Eremothecium gossypii ATCC 10895]AEY98608.1 FAGL209Wp [Eremothecium gossypii FDAG1]